MLPLNDEPIRRALRGALNPQTTDAKVVTLYTDQWRVPAEALLGITAKPFELEAYLNRQTEATNGVILSIGDKDSGWVVFVKDGHLVIDVNNLGKHLLVRSNRAVPVGKSVVRAKFGGGKIDLFFGEDQVASAAGSLGLGALYGQLQVGKDLLPPVSREVAGLQGFEFPAGGIEKVVIRTKR